MTDIQLSSAPPVLLLTGVLLALVGLGSWVVLRARPIGTRLLAGALVVGSVAFVCLVGWLVVQVGPGKSGVVASGEFPGGREFCVVQTYKGLIEPYQVSLYVRDDSGRWRWHYLEHEDNAWRSARAETADGLAVVYRNGERFAEVELDRGPQAPGDVRPDGSLALETLPPELTVEDVARLHHDRYRR